MILVVIATPQVIPAGDSLPLEIVITNSFKKLLYSMMSAIRRLIAMAFLSVLFFSTQAQPGDTPLLSQKEPAAKPYKVLTSGNQITIKSNKDIKQVMLWTSKGNRVVEQKEINSGTFSFKVPVNDKYYFLMVNMEGGKIYTEKIGIN